MGATSGELRFSGELQEKISEHDELGQPVEQWVKVATFRFRLDTTGSKELMSSKAIKTEVTHAVVCRYRSVFADIQRTCSMRILYQGRIFDIKSVIDEDGLHQWAILGCSEGLSRG